MKKIFISFTCIIALFVTMIGTQVSVMAAEGTTYLIVEVFDHYDDNAAAIQEIEVFDINGNEINYAVLETDIYDTAEAANPRYWNSTVWDKSNINDNNTSYRDVNSTMFYCYTEPNSEAWARFILQLPSTQNVSEIKVWAGNTRIPKQVTVYKANAYDLATNIQQRDNTGLTLMGTISPEITTDTVAYSITDIPISTSQELDIESATYEVNSGMEFTTNVVVRNAPSLYAEDITVQYDTNLFEYVSAVPTDPTALEIYHEDTSTPGQVRFIVASKGADYGVNGDSQILNLTFRAKAIGEGEIKVLSGLTADGDGTEYTPTCLGKMFTVLFSDVNNDGQFTLGDLAIAARLLSTTSDTWTPYTPDVDMNGNVEALDLQNIVTAILN